MAIAEQAPGGRTILVVDDNRAIREQVCNSFLSSVFTSCVEAENGRQAIELAQKVKPDLIVLDLSMPVMNGIEAAPALKKILPQTPIILYTLHGDALKAMDFSVVGISAIISKDDPLHLLVDKAQELIGQTGVGTMRLRPNTVPRD